MDLFGFKKRRMKEYAKQYRKMSHKERQSYFERIEMLSNYVAANPFRNKALIEMAKAAQAVDEEDAAIALADPEGDGCG